MFLHLCHLAQALAKALAKAFDGAHDIAFFHVYNKGWGGHAVLAPMWGIFTAFVVFLFPFFLQLS